MPMSTPEAEIQMGWRVLTGDGAREVALLPSSLREPGSKAVMSEFDQLWSFAAIVWLSLKPLLTRVSSEGLEGLGLLPKLRA